MGRAWAVVFARAGHRVALYDRNTQMVETHAIPMIKASLALLADGDTDAPIDEVLARVRIATTLEDALQDVGYVQESVLEDIDIKRSIFEDLGRLTAADCVLASSTSAIKGSEFLEDNPARERALVAHPVNPPSLIPLVEVCPTPWTQAQTTTKATELLTSVGMQPIALRKEIDGFVLNRLQYTLVAEALHLVGEGYCTAADIDRVMTSGLALRWSFIGPFEVAHLNSTGGFQGFVDQLGPMMRHMGKTARTDYPWDDEMVAEIHEQLSEKTPVKDIPQRQLWRDQQILATRKLHDDEETQ